MSELLIHDLGEIATPVGTAPRRGPEQGQVIRLAGHEVLCREGRIAFVGTSEERRERFGELPQVRRLAGSGGTLVPGFVDCHTHLPWAGDRADEFASRLAGATYQEIAAAGGGILSTVRATRAASEDELATNVRTRLDRMLDGGTTTAEAKSGYGLALDAELRQLRAIQRASAEHPVDVVATLMAAHEVPPEHREHRERWIDTIVEEITPAAAEAGLATFCDVFCEKGVFTPEESRRVLAAGAALGLRPRLHADEFVDSKGAELAAELGAASADHLIAVSDAGIEAMAGAGVQAVLLPGVSFFLRDPHFAPARRFVEAAIPVCLATDYNPGSSHTHSLPFIFWLGVFRLGLGIEESLTAITLNPACCLGLGEEVGSIEVGKAADCVVLDRPSLDHFAYRFGGDPIRAVVKGGAVVRGG